MNYSIHVGMYAYASGLERLCKLALACNEYASTGTFPNIRQFNHRISDLLDAVEALPLRGRGLSRFTQRPKDSLEPDLTRMVERVAGGRGRYEHLDSLWDPTAIISTYDEWISLARHISVSESTQKTTAVREAIARALEFATSEANLETAAQGAIEDANAPFYEESVSVMLSLFRLTRWVAAVLDDATYINDGKIPLLYEILSPAFAHPSDFFYSYHMAKIADEDLAEEELIEVLDRIEERDRE